MNTEINLLLAKNETFRFVKVEFPNGRQLYTYKTLEELEKGDFVIVHTPSDEFKIVRVVKVLQLHELDIVPNFAVKWIVQKVDVSRYEELLEKEQEAIKLLNNSKTKKLVGELETELKDSIGVESFQEVEKLTRL